MGTATLERQEVKQASPNKTRKPFVLAAIMLAMFMAAIEATIVTAGVHLLQV